MEVRREKMKEGRKNKNLFIVFCLLSSVFLLPSIDLCFAQDVLSRAKGLLLAKQYVQAIAECNKVINDNLDDAEVSAEANYFIGVGYLNLFDFLTAKKSFRVVVDKYRNTKYYEDAYLGLADVELLQENFHEAVKGYTEFLLTNPSKKRLATLYFRLADVNHRLGNEEESKKYLRKLQEEFPSSFEAKDSERLSPAVEGDFYTVQLGAFTNYDNAQRFVVELKAKGYDVYSVLCMLSGKKLCRVRVGKFKTEAEAEALKKKLEADGYFAKILPKD